MKKKKTANLIMVLIIAAIAIAGVVTAFMLKTSTGDGLGSQYQIRELKDNAVITPGQRIMSAQSPSSATPFWTTPII